MLQELVGDAVSSREVASADEFLSQRQMHQRLTHIESTISTIQAQLMEHGELDTERHFAVVAHLEDLQEGVAANKKLLKELKKNCLCPPSTKEGVICVALMVVVAWLYVVHTFIE